jgi:hypothetical protein
MRQGQVYYNEHLAGVITETNEGERNVTVPGVQAKLSMSLVKETMGN